MVEGGEWRMDEGEIRKEGVKETKVDGWRGRMKETREDGWRGNKKRESEGN